MIVLLGFIIAGMLVVGVVAAFLLYVSVLSIFTAVAIITGLVGTLVFGYWAGYRGRELTRSVAGPALDASRTSPSAFSDGAGTTQPVELQELLTPMQ
jgi:poly(3-hydroxybutyrate) depolymerase